MKRKPTRKRLTMLVTVSVPYDMPPAMARKEVKTNINHHSTWNAMIEEDEVKAISVKPINRRTK